MARKLTAQQAGEIAGVQARTVTKWRREGKLAGERVDDYHGGFHYVYDEHELRKFMADPGRRDRRRRQHESGIPN